MRKEELKHSLHYIQQSKHFHFMGWGKHVNRQNDSPSPVHGFTHYFSYPENHPPSPLLLQNLLIHQVWVQIYLFSEAISYHISLHFISLKFWRCVQNWLLSYMWFCFIYYLFHMCELISLMGFYAPWRLLQYLIHLPSQNTQQCFVQSRYSTVSCGKWWNEMGLNIMKENGLW